MEQVIEQERLEQAEVDKRFAELVEQIDGAIPGEVKEQVATEPMCKPGGRSDQGWCEDS